MNGQRNNTIRFGLDEVLAAPHPLRGRIGLVTNDAARTACEPRELSRIALARASVNVVRLFSPEHGLSARAPDGSPVVDSRDPLTGLPVVSLYGDKLRPNREDLAGLDALVFDVPDIGARFYTYLWTLTHVLEACAEADLPFTVLDRPNPIGGDLAVAEGPMLEISCSSALLGRAAIPIRHCLTLGEFARLWNAEWKLGADVRVIRCAGWPRHQHWPDSGLPFEPTSPAMRSYESALLYPGTCLFEATNLSVGRGTECAFQLVGAPWLNAARVEEAFNARGRRSLRATAELFTPAQSPHENVRCQGVRLQISSAVEVRPVAAGLHWLAIIRALQPAAFRWANYPSAVNPTGERHFERLIGRMGIREALEHNPPELAALIEEWTAAPGWAERVRPHLLYAA